MDIIKSIIPAAGLGTRFLPLTKAIPKELLPLLNIPALQYIIQEGVLSQIKQFALIISRDKHAISSYFDAAPQLQATLKDKGNESALQQLNDLIKQAQFTYVYQNEPLGLGHAISLAEHIINKEYFGIFLPDDIFMSKIPGLAQLIQIARQEKASVIAVQEVPLECVPSYGVIEIKKQITPNLYQVSHLVEKPSIEDAPTNLAIVGRYVLSHKIFNSLDAIRSYGVEGELQLTDAIDHMLKQNEKVFAYKIQGTRFDIGTPVGWLKANISLALQNPDYAPHIKKYLSTFDSLDSFIYNPEKNISHMV